MNMIRFYFALFLVYFTGIALGESIYKWVDEQGVTHYSAAIPADKKGQKLKTQPVQPVVENERKQSSMYEWETDQYLKNNKQRRAEQEEADRQLKEEKANRCAKAKERLGILLQQVPLYRINAKGEREYWEDDAREAETRRMKEEIENNC
jgi:hypothetical protein